MLKLLCMALTATIVGVGVVAGALIVAEAGVARRRGVRIHDPKWTKSNLACGALRLLTTVLTKGLVLGVYALAYNAFHVFEWQGSVAMWLLAFVAYDLGYYAWHRFSHRSPLLWALHETHHQSRDFNLTVSARLGALSMFSQLLFDLPLAFLGVPPVVLISVKIAHSVFMFLMHSRFIGSLGPLGYVFNTPSHHRVHHSAEERHFDTNFAGVFIIFDRLFGTFHREDGIRAYGVHDAERKLHPIRANFAPLHALMRRS